MVQHLVCHVRLVKDELKVRPASSRRRRRRRRRVGHDGQALEAVRWERGRMTGSDGPGQGIAVHPMDIRSMLELALFPGHK